MQWAVEGADGRTGEDRIIWVEAADGAEAERKALASGLLVSRVYAPPPPVAPPPPPELRARPRSNPAQVTKPLSPSWSTLALLSIGVLTGLVVLAMVLTAAYAPGGFLQSGSFGSRRLGSAEVALFDALKGRNFEAAKLALQFEPDLRAQDPETGATVLDKIIDNWDIVADSDAAEARQWKALAEAALVGGAYIDGQGGRSPLYRARESATVNFLLDNGASVDGPPAAYESPLHELAFSDYDADTIRLLISRGANPNRKRSSDGQTPLHIAAAYNSAKAIEALVAGGADVNLRDAKGYTPLKRARISLQTEAAAVLEKHGASE